MGSGLLPKQKVLEKLPYDDNNNEEEKEKEQDRNRRRGCYSHFKGNGSIRKVITLKGHTHSITLFSYILLSFLLLQSSSTKNHFITGYHGTKYCIYTVISFSSDSDWSPVTNLTSSPTLSTLSQSRLLCSQLVHPAIPCCDYTFHSHEGLLTLWFEPVESTRM